MVDTRGASAADPAGRLGERAGSLGWSTAARPPTRAPTPIAATVATVAVARRGETTRVAAASTGSGGPMTRTLASEPALRTIRSTASRTVTGSADGSIRTTT